MHEDRAVRLDAAKLMSNPFLFGTTVFDGGIGTAVNLLAKVSKAARIDLDVGGLFHHSYDAEPGRALLGAVNALIERVTKEVGRPPLLLVDELDKISALPESFRLLTDHRLLVGLNCSVVLTGPGILADRTEEFADHGFAEPVQLYHVRCWQTADPRRADPKGIAKLVDIIDHRIRAVLTEHDGETSPEALISPTAARLLAEMSGGVIRELLALLREAARRAVIEDRLRVETEQATVAVTVRRRQRELLITADDFEIMHRVMRSRHLPSDERASRLLARSNILMYSNDHTWYYPHSLLLGRLGITAE